MESVPERYHDLLKDETRAFLFLATVMQDGSPQLTPVWFDSDGVHILVNTAEGRVKDRNMRSRPGVAMCIVDPKNSYRYLQIRGRVVERIYEGADEHIDSLNHKYRGEPWQFRAGQIRVIYKILPEKIDARDA